MTRKRGDQKQLTIPGRYILQLTQQEWEDLRLENFDLNHGVICPSEALPDFYMLATIRKIAGCRMN